MIRNIGELDRIMRFIVAIVLIDFAASGTFGGYLGVIVWIMGCIFLVTALIGICPIYSLFSINSSSRKRITL